MWSYGQHMVKKKSPAATRAPTSSTAPSKPMVQPPQPNPTVQPPQPEPTSTGPRSPVRSASPRRVSTDNTAASEDKSNEAPNEPKVSSQNPSELSVSSFPMDMRKFWYPISMSRDLKAGDVVGLHILGDPICLYRDRKGKAACLADRCTHRSAPLSIGAVRDEELECKYVIDHWYFLLVFLHWLLLFFN